MAAATTASARSAENSTLGVVAMYWTLPIIKALSPGRDSWEATSSGRAGGRVALAAVDIAERAMAWHALSTARDASRAASLACSSASSSRRWREDIERCKPSANPHDSGDMPKYLSAELTQYVLNIFSKKSPPYHVTQDDVSTPLQRLEVGQITGHQSVRGRGGVIAVLYKTHWAGLSEPSWKREMNLHLSRSLILRYWAGTPDQHRQTNRLYRRKRIGAAQRELSRNNGERFLAPGDACVPRVNWLRRYYDTVLPKGARFCYKGDDGLWWPGKISASTTKDKVYLDRFLDDPGPIQLPISPARYTTSTGAVRGSWCLQFHIASTLPRGIQRT